jgi:hypothetical protein
MVTRLFASSGDARRSVALQVQASRGARSGTSEGLDMTITPPTLTRAAGLCAVAAGLIFIGVQINHPPMNVSSVTSTEWEVRFMAKLVMCGLALAGITGMYLRQVRQIGVLGLVGYVLLGAFYVLEAGVEFMGGFVLPSLADIAPGYVNDVLAASTGGTASGDIGALQTAFAVIGVCYIAGGLVFGIALYRARVLARWAAALLAVSTVSTMALTALPDSFNRPFAVPMGIALVGLGWSLYRETGAVVEQTPSPASVGQPTAAR